MTENLPVANSSQEMISKIDNTTTLLGRGLATIQKKQSIVADQDARYRKARNIFDRITEYGRLAFFFHDFQSIKERYLHYADYSCITQMQPFIDKLSQLSLVFQELKQLADEDFGKAFFLLADMYGGGKGINKDEENHQYFNEYAFQWLHSQRNLNDPEIWRDLANLYISGRGVKKDWEQAIYWYSKASEHGDADAQCHLGGIFSGGSSVDQVDRDRQAVFWYQKAFELGHAWAGCELGYKYLYGYGVERDVKKALVLLQELAERGHSEAQFRLGYLYSRFIFDDEQAFFWYQKAAEQGDSDALAKLWY